MSEKMEHGGRDGGASGFANAPPSATAVAAMDLRRQELVGGLSRLLEGLASGDGSEVVRIVELLDEHVVEHFSAEESWMAQSDYPDRRAHKAEHDAFMKDYVRISVELERMGPTVLVAMRVNNWLADWVKRHVMVSDVALGRFLARESRSSAFGQRPR